MTRWHQPIIPRSNPVYDPRQALLYHTEYEKKEHLQETMMMFTDVKLVFLLITLSLEFVRQSLSLKMCFFALL